MDIIGKSIVLTGAASGIGLALLDELSKCSCRVMAVDKNAPSLEAACARLSDRAAQIVPYVCDLSERVQVDRLFEWALAVLERIDIFFANAGFAYYEEIDTPDWEHIEHIFRVNTFNTLYTIEKMQALYGRQPYKVVVTASAMAFLALPGYALYSATKAALHRFADAYRWQIDDRRKLMMVYPIATRTGFFRAAGEDVPAAWPSQTPQQVARAILRGVRRDRETVFPSFLFRLFLLLDRFVPIGKLEQFIEQRRLQAWKAKRGSRA
ncbi:MAG: SDR family NAD(P)-dependent oxidoreductase [Anaerolineales bacterium]|nr:SDR family NAD(P)-dependent oxidoreductase [Anaerolineales bacterium]